MLIREHSELALCDVLADEKTVLVLDLGRVPALRRILGIRPRAFAAPFGPYGAAASERKRIDERAARFQAARRAGKYPRL